MKILQHRTNNAYDSILLVDANTYTVLGAWPADLPEVMDDYNSDRDNPDAVDQWEETPQEYTDPSDYGDLVSESEY